MSESEAQEETILDFAKRKVNEAVNESDGAIPGIQELATALLAIIAYLESPCPK